MSKFRSSLLVCICLVGLLPLSAEAQQKRNSIRALVNRVNSNSTRNSSRRIYLPIQSTTQSENGDATQDESDLDGLSPADDDQIGDETNEPIPLEGWPGKSLSQIEISPLGSGKTPADQSNRLLEKYVRDWSMMETGEKVFSWESPGIKYQPLLFEDVALERNGQVVLTDNIQTVVSAIHFASSAALLPFHVHHDPVYSCDYPLGFNRPGNCSQKIFQRPFWGLKR